MKYHLKESASGFRPSSHERIFHNNNVHYKLLAIGGFGVSFGLGSIVEALDGDNAGKLYYYDFGGGEQTHKLGKEISPENADQFFTTQNNNEESELR